MTIKVVIADDHPLVREGLHRYLDEEEDILVVGEASDGQELLAVIESSESPPDVILLDVNMPGMDGVQAAREIRRRHPHPEAEVVMLSAFDDRDLVVASVRAGARGYILKTGDTEQVIRTTRLVASGTMVIDPQLIPLLVGELLPGGLPAVRSTTLTARESEVLQLAAYGETNREIADRLSISPEAVKRHLEHVYQKLGVHDRTEAVAVALREGLVN